MDKFSERPAEIFNVWAKMPDDIVLGNNEPGSFSMIPHFFYEFNGDPNVLVIYAGPVLGRRGQNILNMGPEILANYMQEMYTEDRIFCFDNLYEGYINPQLAIIYKALEISNISPSQVNYFSAALNSVELHEEFCEERGIDNRINIYVCNTWEYSLKKESVIKDREYKIENKKKNFVCFNRILRPHRLGLVSLCQEKNLINDAYYSFFGNSTYNGSSIDMDFIKISISMHSSKELYNTVFRNYASLEAKLPLRLNIDWTENANYVKEDDLEFFDNTYFSLVTETYFFPVYYDFRNIGIEGKITDAQSIFFTEKIYKPIIMRHPFILASRPRSLEMLRKLGYKTFSPLINESYDLIENDGERLQAVVDEVERLSKFSHEQWIEWQTEIKDIVDYNHSVLVNREKHTYALTRNKHEN